MSQRKLILAHMDLHDLEEQINIPKKEHLTTNYGMF